MNTQGLTEKEVLISRKTYGDNELTKKKKNSFFRLLLESLGDPIIKILLIALAVKVVILFKSFDWFETIGILIAIFLASFISSISEYGSEAAFERLGEEAAKIKVKVKREGNIKEIEIKDVVKDDLVLLNTGDKIPADGYLISGSIYVDESSINGEAKETEKISTSGIVEDKNKIYRGTIVYNGNAIMKVTEVGNNTIYGKLASELQESEPVSPLKLRLRGLAGIISKIGYVGAILVTISYLFSVIFIANHFDKTLILGTLTNFDVMFNHLMYALTLSVTIIIVAVPEGLPMMITLVLSSNMKRMLKNNVLVRRLVGIETAGSLNVLLTDKTGTLTKGKLEVTEFITGNLKSYKTIESIKQKKFYSTIYESFFYNNESMFDSEGNAVGGNTTDRALLKFIKTRESRFTKVLKKEPFNSQNKYSYVEVDNGERVVYVKGAYEKILGSCTQYLDEENRERTLLEKKVLEEKIEALTKSGTRVLVMAYRKKESLTRDKNALVLLGIIAIRDELREETKEGIDLIKKAGIDIIMITGDHKDTATSIAKEAGVITSKEDIVLTSDELSRMSDEEIKQIASSLKVVARALPKDKSRLVRILEDMNLVVGMTGDGVNDAPALKKANVGFAMGSGTEVCKEASDIVILDDNILSISKAILYGRTIFKSIRKFIIYQLTCNMCALFVSIIGPFIGINTPITIIQMLWINMIMDTFAGLAFSFEPPLKRYMFEPPKKKDEAIMNWYMYSQIIFTGVYSALLCILFLKLPLFKHIIRTGSSYEYLMTAYFALFIFMGVCNAFNARTERLNLLANLKQNVVFILTISFIVIVQLYLIYHGGDLFRTYGLTLKELVIVLLLSFSVIPVDLLRKVYIKRKNYATSV